MTDALPVELQSLTGIGKSILIQRREMWALGLIHSDDQPHISGSTLEEQMKVLQLRATMELRKGAW